jgi:hypothetical protein
MFLKYVSHGFNGIKDSKIITLGMRSMGDCKHGIAFGSCLATRSGYCNACKYQQFVNDLRAHGSAAITLKLSGQVCSIRNHIRSEHFSVK